jgi:hypothetical protein
MEKFVAGALVAAFFTVSLGTPSALAATDSPATTTKRELTPGQIAARERQKKCAAEWHEAKAQGKTEGLTWPKFWSRCNERLKEKAQ